MASFVIVAPFICSSMIIPTTSPNPIVVPSSSSTAAVMLNGMSSTFTKVPTIRTSPNPIVPSSRWLKTFQVISELKIMAVHYYCKTVHMLFWREMTHYAYTFLDISCDWNNSNFV